MKIIMEYLAFIATTLIAIWNIRMQLQIKKIENKQNEKNIKLTKTTEHEYETYKTIWNLVTEVLTKTKYLRLYPKSNHEFKKSPELLVTKEKLDEYLAILNSLERTLIANSPFITKEIKESLEKIIKLAHLEYNQSYSLGDSINDTHMNQAETNLNQMKSLFTNAEELLRTRIII